MHDATAAVIYLPPALTLDSKFAQQCIAHLTRRGYELLTIAREWELVARLLQLGRAQVVIVARRSHINPEWTPRIEVVSEEPEDESSKQRPRNDGRHSRKECRPRIL